MSSPGRKGSKVAKMGRNTEIKEILYFQKPAGRSNTNKMLEFITPRIESMNLRHVMIAWSSGYTLEKFLEATRNLKLKLDITTVTNPKGGTMGGMSVSIDDPTRERLEAKGIKVCYLNDDLRLGEPMSPTPEQKYMREQLLPWMPFHIDPLSLDVGWDTSLLLIISQGFRVCVGCLALAAKHGLIPEGERVLCLAGSATACIMIANKSPRYCYVEEILSYERNSDWSLMNQTRLKKMVAITR
jgi:hypothetical protein